MGISELPRIREFPGKNCDLCGEFIYYGENISTGKQVAFDKRPVYSHTVGEISLVDPDLVDDNLHVVKFVPENERWMHEVLFTLHRNTCTVWIACQEIGVDFATCKEVHDEKNGKKPFLTASIRDMKSGRSSLH